MKGVAMAGEVWDAVVIGAGQAGLATGYHLRRIDLRFRTLEAAAQVGGSWPCYYDSLRLFSPARYSSLPGLPFPGDPDHYPVRDEVVDYLRRYAAHFDLPVVLNSSVKSVRREGEAFAVTGREAFARVVDLVNAGPFNHVAF